MKHLTFGLVWGLKKNPKENNNNGSIKHLGKYTRHALM